MFAEDQSRHLYRVLTGQSYVVIEMNNRCIAVLRSQRRIVSIGVYPSIEDLFYCSLQLFRESDSWTAS